MGTTKNTTALAALMAVQRDLPKFDKGTQGHGYRYLDLPTLISGALPVLHKHGFVLRFVPGRDSDGRHTETAVIAHESGEAYQATMAADPLPASGRTNAVQALGSTSTYLRRYSLQAVLGICAEVDMDAATPRQVNGNGNGEETLAQHFTKRMNVAVEAKASKEACAEIHESAVAEGLRWSKAGKCYVEVGA